MRVPGEKAGAVQRSSAGPEPEGGGWTTRGSLGQRHWAAFSKDRAARRAGEAGSGRPVPAETDREGQTRILQSRGTLVTLTSSARRKVPRAATPATSRHSSQTCLPLKEPRVPEDHEVQGWEEHETSRGCSGEPGSQDLREQTRAVREGSRRQPEGLPLSKNEII